MKPRTDSQSTKARSWTLVLLLGFWTPGATQGATLQLRAQLPASVPLLFPVPAEVTLENADGKPVVVADFPRPHLLRVDIRRVSTGALEYQGFADSSGGLDERQLRPITLAPGQTTRFGTILAARWGADKKPVAAAFTSTGLFSLQFTYPVMRRENGNAQLEYVRSAPVTLLVTNVLARHRAALDDARAMPHVVWLLQPRAAGRGSQAEKAGFEASLRRHLSAHPDSPWASLARFALASRVYEKFLRTGPQSQALAQEITNLLNDAQAEGQVYRDDAARLEKRVEQVLQEKHSRAKSNAASPSTAQAVEVHFRKLLEHMARAETNAIAPLLFPDFRYDARLNASAWLAKLKSEQEATAPFPMSIHFKTVSMTGPEEATVLTANVTFESGVRKSVRRVAATYQLTNATWSLAAWNNLGNTGP